MCSYNSAKTVIYPSYVLGHLGSESGVGSQNIGTNRGAPPFELNAEWKETKLRKKWWFVSHARSRFCLHPFNRASGRSQKKVKIWGIFGDKFAKKMFMFMIITLHH